MNTIHDDHATTGHVPADPLGAYCPVCLAVPGEACEAPSVHPLRVRAAEEMAR